MRLQDSNRRASYNDLQVQHTVKEQKRKEQMAREKQEKLQQQEELRETYNDFKYTSLKLFKIDKFLLITVFFCIFFFIYSLIQGSFGNIFSCIISIIFTILVGKSSYKKNDEPKLTNTLIWNLSQSLYDFIDLKIPFEVFSNKQKWLDTYTVFGVIIYILCSPTNILYGLITTLIIISYLVAFSMKDLKGIYNRVKIIIIALFIGIIVHPILNYVLSGTIVFQSMNVILLNLFTILKIYTNNTTIYHT